ncbi:amidohydrolase family protein [Candidatus Poriferisocius sp.]|uniref:amidohydrolase family protein n=1 Tax=Candidatus Poriferisocius sp. TaxID=3101276 RepID=UPI003B02C74E
MNGGEQAGPPVTAIINIGTLLTGDVVDPYGTATSMLIENGVITRLGDTTATDGEQVIDAGGATVGPGLIDSHCHVVLGDYTPRQRAIGFLESYVHGGITSCISPGEIHLPGRPHDAEGVKALAVLAHRSWSGYRPNGMKVSGGAIILEPVLTAADLQEVASQGVGLAKFGFGLYEDPADGLPQVRDAQAAGIKVMAHSGGASIPGSKPISAEHLMLLKPDVCGHVNGGPTSLDDTKLDRLVRETDLTLQLVQAGNLRSSLRVVEAVRDIGGERRVIIGSDTPTGTGVMPLGVIKTMAELSSLGDVDPGVVWAWASGSVADVYNLSAGKIQVGRPADIVIADAPWGSHGQGAVGALARGDIPGISAVLIDGEIRALTSRNTPATSTPAVVVPPINDPCGSEHVC